MTFQEIILYLQKYWIKMGCIIIQPVDIQVGAATSHPMTCLNAISDQSIAIAYTQPSRRPTDGRYSKSKNRLQHYYQFQVVIKPAPFDIQEIYLRSLDMLGIDLKNNDIRFVEDNWENETLGASGVGWEIWLNGMEITQFTYFQKVCGIPCDKIVVELTYGLERISMHIQNVENVFDLVWANSKFGKVKYGDIFYRNEIEQSEYNFQHSDINFLLESFKNHQKQSISLLDQDKGLPIPSYEHLLKSIHYFNILDARNVFSVNERQMYISKIYNLIKKIAKIYLNSKK
ncbi:glycine--tRNA ligase subunit alpha [Candidatus Riesia pediculicola]|uniref:Glycine--tRNA ligase alpha subunit n=1 Tax=Riesia pediculicola (strain USDA) TaxID=515618 RepID=D4G8Z8_RIEPU|nr:glycine--tRNA ligase subunit alpha [Candidatus Riesia pediculicola]ADD79584.1 glycyl-tRNA synthetase, alpha subunit [Candidatus Riesia pediculicola USDA]ARC54006.1 glycine--tRNA ligase subunit alpha [Candidatus Riesia pediculicola]